MEVSNIIPINNTVSFIKTLQINIIKDKAHIIFNNKLLTINFNPKMTMIDIFNSFLVEAFKLGYMTHEKTNKKQ